MSDQFSETKTTGFLSRLFNSVMGIFIGIILFFGSFMLLFWNEGRPNNYDTYKTAVEMDATNEASENNLRLVAAKGKLTANERVGDGLYLIPAENVYVKRQVEVYSWSEKSESTSQSNIGGSETTSTTYTYEKKWVNEAPDSGSFRKPEGHINIQKTIQDSVSASKDARLGIHNINLIQTTLPELQKLIPNPGNTTIASMTFPAGSVIPQITNDYIYIGKSSIDTPQIGDMKISYYILPAGTEVIAFAKKNGLTLEKFKAENGVEAYRLFKGTRDEALAAVQTEDTIMRWVFRGIGFMMMWIGMMMILGPLSVISDIIPFIGKVTGMILSGITFLIAFVLSAITIVVSMILHNIYALLVIGLLLIGLIGFVLYKRRQKK